MKDDACRILAHLSCWTSAVDAGGLEAPASDDGLLTVGVLELGFASSRFVCRFVFGRVDFRAEIPLGSALEDDEALRKRLETIRAALLMAQALVNAELAGCDWLAGDSRATVAAVLDAAGESYSILNGDGGAVEAGLGWRGLAERLNDRLRGLDAGLVVFMA